MPLQYKVTDGRPSRVLRLLKSLGYSVNRRSHLKSSLLESLECKTVCVKIGNGKANIELLEDPLRISTTVKSLENLISNRNNDE